MTTNVRDNREGLFLETTAQIHRLLGSPEMQRGIEELALIKCAHRGSFMANSMPLSVDFTGLSRPT